MNANLRYVIAGLNLEQRGLLLDALLNGDGADLDEGVSNIYTYIMLLQQELADKKQRMRELGAKGGSARKKAADNLTADLFDEDKAVFDETEATVKRRDDKRKEAKENNIINKKIKNLFNVVEKENKEEVKTFVPPLIDEVREFVTKEGLAVDPEVFVDFYDSHGWKVGQTAIKNWKATARLWHRRSDKGKPPPEKTEKSSAKKNDDEVYWHELLERQRPEHELLGECVSVAVGEGRKANSRINVTDDVSDNETEDLCQSPFVRFIRRIEDK